MIDDSDICLEQLRVDGGAVANNFLMQFQADLLGIEVERPTQIETTGLGPAYLAGITSGVWQNVEELEKYRKIDTIFLPQLNKDHLEQKLCDWQTSIQKVDQCCSRRLTMRLQWKYSLIINLTVIAVLVVFYFFLYDTVTQGDGVSNMYSGQNKVPY